jgi:nucleoside-diphosphate-sugar epimerase
MGTPIKDLAARILEVTGSGSALHIVPARAAEVTCFTADVTRMRDLLGLEPPADPLMYLPEMVNGKVTAHG